ncbi:ferritin-like domain-containing protein [Kitasatospora griseola]|uniref:ferritin-like domain-containing protein n=1 Tax=Kitasatospora griseola TaxID=2064 RepID=UPI0038111B6E
MTTFATKPMTIAELLNVPAADHDLEWIKKSLQSAIALELSTLPPYLCGMWSIKTDSSEAEAVIKSIVHDEMYHLGMACNMLAAVGGTPHILAAAPTYPGKLPGNVRPTIDVYLQGLTKDYVREVFMEIEMPENPLARLNEEWVTIGQFYDAVRDAFNNVEPPIGDHPQMETSIGRNSLTKFTSVEQITSAIDVIKEQGEGTSHLPDDPTPDGGLAHYYSFGEIWKGHRLVPTPDGPTPYDWVGDPVPFPETYPMGRLTADRWPNPAEPVGKLLTSFNDKYTEMLRLLEKAWQDGDPSALSQSVGAMFSLKPAAHALMAEPLPDDSTHVYGPEFLVSPNNHPNHS